MPGASEGTRRVTTVNANWIAGPDEGNMGEMPWTAA